MDSEAASDSWEQWFATHVDWFNDQVDESEAKKYEELFDERGYYVGLRRVWE